MTFIQRCPLFRSGIIHYCDCVVWGSILSKRPLIHRGALILEGPLSEVFTKYWTYLSHSRMAESAGKSEGRGSTPVSCVDVGLEVVQEGEEEGERRNTCVGGEREREGGENIYSSVGRRDSCLLGSIIFIFFCKSTWFNSVKFNL